MSRYRYFTPAEDTFLRDNIDSCYTLYDLVDLFNTNFPEHITNYANLQKRLQKLGLKKRTHNIRKEKVHHKNPIGTVIYTRGRNYARVKTEKGYIGAIPYFREKYGRGADEMPIHLNGDLCDFSESNIEWVSKSIFSSLHWRKWIFSDSELTKTAILAAKLLEFFPDIRHNENQYYRNRRF